jgi:hypothetical protein
MDKELYDLKNWAIETLKEYKAELLIRQQVTGKTPNELKKLDRFLNALAVDTEGTYADMMDDVRRKGLTQKEFANMGRNLEERIMNSFRVLPDDPAHHMYSLRTAGDLIQNVEPGVREMGLQILRDEGYILGNVRQNLTSLAEATHQGRTGKGAELAALGEIKVDKTKTPIAHPRGTRDPLISRTVDFTTIKTPEDFANAYRPLLEQQKADLAKVLKKGSPEATRRSIISEEVAGQGGPRNIFSTDVPQVDVKRGRDIITQAPDVMRRAYQSMKLDFKAGGVGMIGGLLTSEEGMTKLRKGDVLGAVQSAGTEMVAGEVFSQAAQFVLPKLPALGRALAPVLQAAGPASMVVTPTQQITSSSGRAQEARKREGRISFNLGGAKFTLPEFGLSEQLGIN